MKNHISATYPVAVSTIRTKINLKTISIWAAALAIGLISTTGILRAELKFSKPVVMLKGKIQAEETGKAHSARVSIRTAEKPEEEIASSVSNSESGKYLVVLAPNTKYVVRVLSRGKITKEEVIETPIAKENTLQMTKDFMLSSKGESQELGILVR
ncbi:MAG: hypothetical protein ABI778_04455 [Ignavibacteriota bacterium]